MTAEIEDVVYRVLEDVLKKDRTSMRPGDDIIQDLKMDSDDASFLLVPELERALRVKIPPEQWGKVATIAEVVELLKKHIRPGETAN